MTTKKIIHPLLLTFVSISLWFAFTVIGWGLYHLAVWIGGLL